jgi:hypothetical protein
MELKSYYAQDKNGETIPGAYVYLYEPGTTNLVSGHQDVNGANLTNPFEADEDGLIQFAAPDGRYDLRVTGGGLDRTIQIQCLDLTAAVSQVAADANRAESEADRAEVAKGAAFVNADVYESIAAGLANVGNDEQFQVVEGDEVVRYKRVDANTENEVARYPSQSAFDDIYRERLIARRTAWLRSQQLDQSKPKSAVVILLGQSNNAPRGTSISGTVSTDVFMPVGGNATAYYAFNSTNAQWTTNYTDVASAVVHEEGSGETPCSGAAIGLLGTNYQRVYIASAAIGARSLDVLRGFPIGNVHALCQRLCEISRTSGYTPEVFFYTDHGEADAAAGATETDYYEDGLAYYRQCQSLAAVAMEKPGYSAPVLFHNPIVGVSEATRGISNAIRRLAKDIENGMLLGGRYQYPHEVDRVHAEETGYRMKGEQAGFVMRDFADSKTRFQALQMVDAKWSGPTVIATFNKEIERDLTVNYGENLNASLALAGFEFFDDGSGIQITGVSTEGRKAVLTLASEPVGALQTLRIASQTISGALTAGSENLPGSQIKATGFSRKSILDHTFTIEDFAQPQTINARAA